MWGIQIHRVLGDSSQRSIAGKFSSVSIALVNGGHKARLADDYPQVGGILNLLRRRPEQVRESGKMWVITSRLGVSPGGRSSITQNNIVSMPGADRVYNIRAVTLSVPRLQTAVEGQM